MTSTVTTREKWLAQRAELMAAERAFTKQRDDLNALRRTMPWVKIEKDYVFDGPKGAVSLNDLFEGRSQLIVYHFMFTPDWGVGLQVVLILGRPFRRRHPAPACA